LQKRSDHGRSAKTSKTPKMKKEGYKQDARYDSILAPRNRKNGSVYGRRRKKKKYKTRQVIGRRFVT